MQRQADTSRATGPTSGGQLARAGANPVLTLLKQTTRGRVCARDGRGHPRDSRTRYRTTGRENCELDRGNGIPPSRLIPEKARTRFYFSPAKISGGLNV